MFILVYTFQIPLGVSPPKSSCSSTSFSSTINESQPGTSHSSASSTPQQTANGSASMLSGKCASLIISDQYRRVFVLLLDGVLLKQLV